MADCRKDIKNLAVLLRCVAHAVGCNHGQPVHGCQAEQQLVAAFFIALLVALEFEIDIAVPVNCGEPFHELACFVVSAACQRRGNWAFVASGDADQSGGELFEVFECGGALGLCCLPHLEARDELAKILVTDLRCAEQYDAWRLVRVLMRQPRRRCEFVADGADRDLCADARFHSAMLGRRMKARDTIETIAVGKGDGGHIELGRAFCERLGL